MPSPISLSALERNRVSIRKQQDLMCPERLISSPELQERVFRPVSPARAVIMNTSTSPRTSGARVLFQAPIDFHSSSLRARRSILSRRSDEDRRGSVEEELADQSYECALRESANSPDIERYLRCESPLTVESSPNTTLHGYECENYSKESADSPPVVRCNGDSENIEIPTTAHEEYEEDLSPVKTPEMSGFEIPTTAQEEYEEDLSPVKTPEMSGFEIPTTAQEEYEEDLSPVKTPEMSGFEIPTTAQEEYEEDLSPVKTPEMNGFEIPTTAQEEYEEDLSPVKTPEMSDFEIPTTAQEEYEEDCSPVKTPEMSDFEIPTTVQEEYEEDCSPVKTPEISDFDNGVEDTDMSTKRQNSAMIRRLEPRLPSPVRERAAGDLYRDPSQLTREERALQRAMMQFSEMEMKEKTKETKRKTRLKGALGNGPR
ncbi:hypothetical protein OS493_013032 [Desmophyllum pertusum]|uniref:Uncharacterized protein n=1 Tax=Desmophyllum pertusum TaxID=174260 RepID=A0A9X0CRK9_9CNID|nr:hypothetical protein OS493_013032 [Desmophyllum pertusum]